MTTPATHQLRRRFARWVTKNGGVLRDRAQNEFVRFEANGRVAIVYERKGQIGAMAGAAETPTIWAAFMAGQPFDLRPETVGDGRSQIVGRKAVAFATADVRSGRSEPLSIRALCRSTGLPVRTVARVARANGGCIRGMKLMRSDAR